MRNTCAKPQLTLSVNHNINSLYWMLVDHSYNCHHMSVDHSYNCHHMSVDHSYDCHHMSVDHSYNCHPMSVDHSYNCHHKSVTHSYNCHPMSHLTRFGCMQLSDSLPTDWLHLIAGIHGGAWMDIVLNDIRFALVPFNINLNVIPKWHLAMLNMGFDSELTMSNHVLPCNLKLSLSRIAAYRQTWLNVYD